MMEIDFSANKLRHRHVRSHLKQRYAQQPKGEVRTAALNPLSYPLMTDGYMDMSPKSSQVESFNESRVSCASDANLSPPRSKHPIGRSSPANPVNFSKQAFKGSPSSGATMLEKVLEMDARRSTCAAATHEDDSSYMDMKPGVCDMPDAPEPELGTAPVVVTPFQRKDSFSLIDSMVASRSAVTPSTPCSVPHIKQPLLETNGKQLKKVDVKTPTSTEKCSTPDGYIDMTFKGRPKMTSTPEPTKAVAKIPDKTPDGYVDMSFKDVRKNLVDSNSMSAKKNKAQQQPPHPLLENKVAQCCAGKENQQTAVAQQQQPPRQSSKPIAIQQTTKSKRSSVGSGFFRRKLSGDETTPSKPNILPLVQSFASLGRRKKTSKKASATVDSPANAGAPIFPLSPDKGAVPLDDEASCKSGAESRLSCDLEIRSLERVDEIVNWDRRGPCALADAEEDEDDEDENCDYIAMTPGVALQRNVSESSCLRRSFSGRGETEADDKVAHSLQRCTSVPTTMVNDAHSWKRCTSVPEVGSGAVGAASCEADESKCDSRVTCCASADTEDRLCQRMTVNTSQPQVTQNYTDVPKTCTASSTHIPHR